MPACCGLRVAAPRGGAAKLEPPRESALSRFLAASRISAWSRPLKMVEDASYAKSTVPGLQSSWRAETYARNSRTCRKVCASTSTPASPESLSLMWSREYRRSKKV